MGSLRGTVAGLACLLAASIACSSKDPSPAPARVETPPTAPTAPANGCAFPPVLALARTTTVDGQVFSTWWADDGTPTVRTIGWTVPLAYVRKLTGVATEPPKLELPLPDGVASRTSIRGITLWVESGHPPLGVYDTPHVHFLLGLIGAEELRAIDCLDKTLPPSDDVPSDFILVPPPGDCSPGCGQAAIDVQAPELNKERFTISASLRYYQGRRVATDVHASSAYLEKKTVLDLPRMALTKPVHLAAGGLYPMRLRGEYDATCDQYAFILSDFEGP